MMQILLMILLFPVLAAGDVGFSAGGETGNTIEWTESEMGGVYNPDEFSASRERARTGHWSFRAENIPPIAKNQDAKVLRWYFFGKPGIAPGDNYFYRAWYYIESGYNDQFWRNNQQWKIYPSDQGAVKGCGLTFRIGFQRFGSPTAKRELLLVHHACQQGWINCVDVAADRPGTPSGMYRQVNPITIPNDKWFEVQVWYKPARTNGQIIIWQNGAQILNITHPNLDTVSGKPGCNSKKLYWGIGSYVALEAPGIHRVYIDDVAVADKYIVDATLPPPPPPHARFGGLSIGPALLSKIPPSP